MLKVFKQNKNDLIPFVYEYLLSVPTSYNNNDNNLKWPLLLFLHGSGESHPPIEKILKLGPPKLIDYYSKNPHSIDDSIFETAKFLAENFVTCSPQVSEGYGWNFQVLNNLIDQIQQNYNIDQNKNLLYWNQYGWLWNMVSCNASTKSFCCNYSNMWWW